MRGASNVQLKQLDGMSISELIDMIEDHGYSTEALSNDEIYELAKPIWDNLVRSSNIKDYGTFTKDFSSQMLYGANEVELGKQWANNKLLTSLSEKQEFLGTIRRGQYITVLYKQTSNTQPGEFLGRLVLGEEDSLIKIFGATIY